MDITADPGYRNRGFVLSIRPSSANEGVFMVWWHRPDDDGHGHCWISQGDPLYPLCHAVCTDHPDHWPALVDMLLDDPRTAAAMTQLPATPGPTE